MKGRAALLFGALLAATAASAQGDFLFGDIPGLDKEPSVQIDLNPEMMQLFGGAAKGADPTAAAAFEGITNVRVRVYEDISDEIPDVMKFVNDTTTRLEGDGWHSIVRVSEDNEQVRIYVKPGADSTIAGLTLMVTDGGGGEAVFINVAGAIQPAQIGRLMGAVGMNGMFNGVPGFGAGAPQKAPAD